MNLRLSITLEGYFNLYYRNATIRALEDTHLVCMSRCHYERRLKAIEVQHLNDLLKFLSDLPLFSGWPRTFLLKVKYDFINKSYIRNSYVYKNGDPSGKVYIVINGEFQETCKISIDQGLNDEDCLLLLPEEKKRVSEFRANFSIKKPSYIPTRDRNVDVFHKFNIDSFG